MKTELTEKIEEAKALVRERILPYHDRLGRMRYLLGWIDGAASQTRSDRCRAAIHYTGQAIQALRKQLEDQNGKH